MAAADPARSTVQTRPRFFPGPHITATTPVPGLGSQQEEIYLRLSWVSMIYSAAYLIVYVIGLLSRDYQVRGEDFTANATWGATYALAVSITVYVLAAARRFSPEATCTLALIYEVAAAMGIDAWLTWVPITPTDDKFGISWVGVWLICFVAIVPVSPAKNALAALAAASVSPVMLWIGMLRGSANPSWSGTVQLIYPNYVCVLLALATARIIYRLRVEVSEARAMGSYRLEQQLGHGGMGEVWKAKHHTLVRPAAIKLIRPSAIGGKDPESVRTVFRRFEREAQATAALRSINTITIYDFGISDDGSFYYVMELLEGLDLDQLISRFGPVPPARAIHLIRQICHSLEEAHSKGLVHRDVKPANIYVCHQGPDYDFVKVLDFGLVRSAGPESDESRLTQVGVTAGTPAYIAPELALAKPNIDGRADLYSVGCVAYWMLTGRLVFEARTPLEMAMKHVQETPLPFSEVSERPVPAGLEQLILQCLNKDPDCRPQTARELERGLASLEQQWLAGNQDEDLRWSNDAAEEWWRLHLPQYAG